MIVFPSVGHSQVVRGVIADAGNRPLGGVVVILLAADQREAARGLSNDRGEYGVTAAGPGTYQLRTLRIGYEPTISPTFALGPTEVRMQRMTLASLPIALDTIRAFGRNPCRVVNGDSSATLSRVWEQARTALVAAQLTSKARTILATTLVYERTQDRSSQRIGAQVTDVRSDFVHQPWRSLAPDTLRALGYVYTAGDVRVYNAPGVDALASDHFLDDHCLRISEGSTPDKLGIEFEPSSDRKGIAEIRGTLWLDRRTNELREIEYRYVNVSREEELAAGGTMSFTRLRNGMWVVSRWNIRMPTILLAPLYDSRLHLVGYEPRVDSIRVSGGVIVLAVLSSRRVRDTLWTGRRLALRGSILDSMSGQPVSDAEISLAGTTQSVTSDIAGRFEIQGVLPGRYDMQVRTRSLDSVNAIDQRSILFTDSSMTVSVRVPTASMVAVSICGNPSRQGRAYEGMAFGLVSDAAGDPAPNVEVTARWLDAVRPEAASERHTMTTRTDARGLFRFCGLPVDRALAMEADNDTVTTPPAALRISQGQRLVRVELSMTEPLAATSSFRGRVTDSTNTGIRDVEVSLPEFGVQTRTDVTGAFRLTGLVPGNHRVVARRLGYGALDTRLEFERGVETEQAIVLTRITVLDSLLSTTRSFRDPGLEAFEEHRKMGLGQFVTKAEILTREGSLLSSFLQQKPGLAVLTSPGGDWVAGRRPMKCLQARASTKQEAGGVACEIYYVPSSAERSLGMPIACYSRVYLDNQLMNPGVPTPPFNLRMVPPTQVEAMEFYAGPTQVPAEYMSRNSTCGVLVIHTRRP
jgi:hypothetical protein